MTEEIKKSEQFANQLLSLVQKFFGETPTQAVATPVEQVTKSVDEEMRVALFVVLEPQDGDLTNDAHLDTYTEADIELACKSFNLHCQKANLFHLVQTEEVEILESYISPVEFNLDGEIVKKGTWLQKWYFPETEVGETLWQDVKNGVLTGLSIGCVAEREELND